VKHEDGGTRYNEITTRGRKPPMTTKKLKTSGVLSFLKKIADNPVARAAAANQAFAVGTALLAKLAKKTS
jgi:hypothetical protein